MTASDYIVAVLALILYYLIGRFFAKKISPKDCRSLFLKYYSIAFFIATISILIAHFAFVLDGNLDGLPSAIDHGNDSVRYLLSAESIIDEGINTDATKYYGTYGAYTYMLLIVILFMIFGINNLVIIFFNALLYSLSVVLFGKFASFYFNFKNVKRSMLFFILYFSFLSSVIIPLKEILVLFLALIILINIQKLRSQFNYRNIFLLLIGIFLLFFTRAYVALILFISSILIIFVRLSIKNIFASIIILSLGLFVLTNIKIGGIGFLNLYQDANFSIGVWRAEENLTATGAEEAFKIIRSGQLDYITMVYYQTLNTFFRPFITSYPRREVFLSFGTYIRSLLWYSGSFFWYFLLPSIIYGFIHMVKNRKDLLILYLPVILFFVFFIFAYNMLRYQMVTRIFWILIGIYGLQYYSKWKKYIPFWIALYIAIALFTF